VKAPSTSFQDALDQVELADQLGIDFAWEVEHHFLEDSHSSAPRSSCGVQPRTKRIRLGTGSRSPPGYKLLRPGRRTPTHR
jgi:alkanesulfonate monooxygenase SsuD/methylene tetrahydromethanopterin reductase-like flavin-dependent oxidoreductase (luciferase family)